MSSHPYHNIVTQQAILTNGTREEVIRWLVWNDPNGVWTDLDSEAEDKPSLTLEQAREWMQKSLFETV